MIVITGATGFIGKRLVGELIKKHKPSSILCLVWQKNTMREMQGRNWLKKMRVRLRKIDLLDKKSLIDLPQHPRLIFHLAATTDTALSDHSCNDIGTRNLIEALAPNETTHFVYTGTCAMYCGRKNCRKPLDEKEKPTPSNRYGRSKINAEKILEKATKGRKFSLTILRPPTVYGSNPRDNSLFDFMKKLIVKGSPLARLNWPGLTSLVWVDDMAKVISWSAEHPPRRGKTESFVVSTDSLTLAKISQLMHERMGKEYREINIPGWLWQLAASLRGLIFASEQLLPPSIYNLIWRASLVVDNVLYCDAKKIKAFFPGWRPALFKDKLDEVII